jgi:hypothetical membrane protein
MKYKDVAGALLVIAGIVAIMGIITAEATYPGYSTAKNDISDLGATRPPNSIIKQPAFNWWRFLHLSRFWTQQVVWTACTFSWALWRRRDKSSPL